MSSSNSKRKFQTLLTIDKDTTNRIVSDAIAKKGNRYKGAVIFHELSDGSEVAIKQLGLSRLEAIIMKKYNHLNILPLKDIGECSVKWVGRYPQNTSVGYTVIVMPKVQCSVRQIIYETYPWQLWVSLFLDATEGIHYLFNGDRRVHVLHQDFKSDNIFMSKDFRAMVADFDMSAVVDSSLYAKHKCARARSGCGTVGHCDPYSLRARSVTCELTESYSVGIVLLEGMIGVPGSNLPVWSIPQYYVKRATLRGWPEDVALCIASLGLAATHPTRSKRISLCTLKSHLEALYLFSHGLITSCPAPVDISPDPWDGIAVVGSRIMNMAEATSWAQVATTKADMLKRPWPLHVPLYSGLEVPPGDDPIYGEDSLKSPELNLATFRPPNVSFDDPEDYQCNLLFPKGVNTPMVPAPCACGQLRPKLGITQSLMTHLKTENRKPLQVKDISFGRLKVLPEARSGFCAASEGTVNTQSNEAWSLMGMIQKAFGGCGIGPHQPPVKRNMLPAIGGAIPMEQLKGNGRQAPLTATSVVPDASPQFWANLFGKHQEMSAQQERNNNTAAAIHNNNNANTLVNNTNAKSHNINTNINTKSPLTITNNLQQENTTANTSTLSIHHLQSPTSPNTTANSLPATRKVISSKEVAAAGPNGISVVGSPPVVVTMPQTFAVTSGIATTLPLDVKASSRLLFSQQQGASNERGGDETTTAGSPFGQRSPGVAAPPGVARE